MGSSPAHPVHPCRLGNRPGPSFTFAGTGRPQCLDHLPHAQGAPRAVSTPCLRAGDLVRGCRRCGRSSLPGGARGPEHGHLNLGARPLGGGAPVPTLLVLPHPYPWAGDHSGSLPSEGSFRIAGLPSPLPVDGALDGPVLCASRDPPTGRAASPPRCCVHAWNGPAASGRPSTPSDFPPSHPGGGEGPNGICAAEPPGRRWRESYWGGGKPTWERTGRCPC